MPEENQNVGKRIGQANTSNLRSWADNMIAFQNQARQEQMNKFNDERDTGLKDVYTSGLNSTNHGVAQNCDRTFRIGLVAKGIRDYFDDYANVDDIPLVDSFKDSNPEYEDAIWQFVLDDSQICDPHPLYQKLGLEPSEEILEETTVSEDTGSNPLTNIAGGITESILGMPKLAGYMGADLGAESIKLFGGDEEKANAAAEEIKSYIDKLSFGDEESRWYKLPKGASDLLLAYLLGKGLLPQSNIKNLGTGTKMITNGIQGVGDMALYDMISDSELPSLGSLEFGGVVGALSPLIGPAYKGVKGLLKKGAEKEIERSIPKVSKLTETRQDYFLKEFGQTFEDFMKERKLTTYEDLKNYFSASKEAKLNALKQIKGTYKSPEQDAIVDWVVDYATKTNDKEFLPRFLELQEKNNKGGLEMREGEEFKTYFERHGSFNFEGKTGEEIDTLTNMDDAYRNWQRKIADENGFGNLADINNEIQAGWYLNKYLRDMTKIGKKGMTLLDFAIAVSTGDFTAAVTYLLSKRILGGAKMNEKYVKLLQWMLKSGNADKIAVDYEKIQSMQDEKEFLKWVEENYGKAENGLPNIEGVSSTVGTKPNINLNKGEDLVSSPTGETWIKKENNGREGIDFVM